MAVMLKVGARQAEGEQTNCADADESKNADVLRIGAQFMFDTPVERLSALRPPYIVEAFDKAEPGGPSNGYLGAAALAFEPSSDH